jgi:hypothetical protein
VATALQIAVTLTDHAYRQSDYQTYEKVSLSRVDTLRGGATAVPEKTRKIDDVYLVGRHADDETRSIREVLVPAAQRHRGLISSKSKTTSYLSVLQPTGQFETFTTVIDLTISTHRAGRFS